MFPPRHVFDVPLPGSGRLRLGDRPLVMGVLNVSPDSFADEPSAAGGPAAAIDRALRMVDEGADIIDIGGESSRPGADAVTLEDERARVLPVVRGLAGRVPVPISVDTYKAGLARDVLAEGAAIINDISGLRYDAGMAAVVAAGSAALVIMHMRGRAKTMYAEAAYEDVVAEVTEELRERVAVASAAGVSRDRLILDPGLGFAKQAAHSYGALARLAEFAAALGRPLLVGPSRKSFLRDAVGGRPALERDWGTAAAVAAAVLGGAHIVRVHAVAEMAQVVRVTEQIRLHGMPQESHG
ncbi:MAG: dihydropteroate synthase [Acidobacteriota bacterium]